MMPKILVTGATGFIGSHLIQELVSRGHEVYGVSMQSTSRHMVALQPFLKDSIMMFCDIVDYKGIGSIIKSIDPDVVVHLAALSPVRNSFDNPFAYVRVNVTGTLNIAYSLLEMDDFKKKKLIYASTAEVYGPQKVQPIREDVVLNPSSPYANTKASTDMYLRMLTNISFQHAQGREDIHRSSRLGKGLHVRYRPCGRIPRSDGASAGHGRGFQCRSRCWHIK